MSRTNDHYYRLNRAAVLNASQVCYLCGFKIDMTLTQEDPMSASVDHVIPFSKGGTNDIENLRPCHLHCNRKKHSKDHADIRKHGNVKW